jgi:signal transduction histidine kinase
MIRPMGEPPRDPAEEAAEDAARRRFRRDLAHELATPLTPIAGYLRILESGKLGPLSEPQLRVVEAMRASLERLAGIVERLGDSPARPGGETPVAGASRPAGDGRGGPG